MSQAIVRNGGAEAIGGLGFLHRLAENRLNMQTLINVSYLVLYALAVLLVSLTDNDPAVAKPAWDLFIPAVGLVSAISGWRQFAGNSASSRAHYVVRQLLHWGALLAVFHLLFVSDVQHFLRAETDGFVIIYLVGLTSILAGIYLDWKMGIFGLFLIFSGIFVAFLDDNAMLIAVTAAALFAILATVRIWIRYNERLGKERELKTGALGSGRG